MVEDGVLDDARLEGGGPYPSEVSKLLLKALPDYGQGVEMTLPPHVEVDDSEEEDVKGDDVEEKDVKVDGVELELVEVVSSVSGGG